MIFRRWSGFRGQRGYLRRGGGRWLGFRRNRWGQGVGQGRGRRGGLRNRGRGKGNQRKQPPPSKEDLDKEIDSYMAGTRSVLDKDLDTYMMEAEVGK